MTTEYITNEEQVGLPPLQQSRKAVWDYYRIEFLKSGYPGRRQRGELQAHPLYGTYVIADYLAQYRETRDVMFLRAAQKVADAAIEQMEPIGDGIAFMYRPDGTGVSLRQQEFYSGLTQSRYADSLSKLEAVSQPGKYAEALRAVLASLTVPLSEGGVAAYTNKGGLIIEEYPSPIPDLTLNGWTTATTILANLPASGNDVDISGVLDASMRGLEELVGLYDVPELANTRYRLTGPAEFFVDSDSASFKILDCAVKMSEFGLFSARTVGDPGAADKGSILAPVGDTVMLAPARQKHFVAQLTRATWPESNMLHLVIEVEGPTNVAVEIGTGDYNPLRTMIEVSERRSLGVHFLEAGTHTLEIEVPWHKAELIAYPTNFRKNIAGNQFNQYHFIHVDTLRKLAKFSRSSILSYYAERWADYPPRWNTLREYRQDGISLERFDPKVHK